MPARKRRARRLPLLVAVLVVMALLGGCVPVTPRVVKIGLVAPFEGRYREIGADVIPAVRLALREWSAQNAAQSAAKGGRALAFELVAYDDGGDPALAVEAARRLAADPDVELVIGHWRADTTQAALEVYAEAGLPLVAFTPAPLDGPGEYYNLAAPEADLREAAGAWAEGQPGISLLFETGDVLEAVEAVSASPGEQVVCGPVCGLRQFASLAGPRADDVAFVTGAALPADSGLADERLEAFIAGYKEGSLGTEPGLYAASAYEATWFAMTLLAERHGYTLPGAPAAAVAIGEDGRRIDAPVMLYRWQNGERMLVERLR